MISKPRGWRYESVRHSLAAKGVSTSTGRRYNLSKITEQVSAAQSAIAKDIREAGAAQKAAREKAVLGLVAGRSARYDVAAQPLTAAQEERAQAAYIQSRLSSRLQSIGMRQEELRNLRATIDRVDDVMRKEGVSPEGLSSASPELQMDVANLVRQVRILRAVQAQNLYGLTGAERAEVGDIVENIERVTGRKLPPIREYVEPQSEAQVERSEAYARAREKRDFEERQAQRQENVARYAAEYQRRKADEQKAAAEAEASRGAAGASKGFGRDVPKNEEDLKRYRREKRQAYGEVDKSLRSKYNIFSRGV